MQRSKATIACPVCQRPTLVFRFKLDALGAEQLDHIDQHCGCALSQEEWDAAYVRADLEKQPYTPTDDDLWNQAMDSAFAKAKEKEAATSDSSS